MSSEVTLSYSYGASATPLLGETIGANLRRVAVAYPDAEVLVDVPASRRWTYAAFDAETDTLARGLIAAGLAAGDRVGIWAPNCAEWVLLQYASAKAGIILVTINLAYRGDELSYALRQSGVGVLVSAERFKTSDYRAMIDEVRAELDALNEVIFIGTPQWNGLFEAGRAAAAGGDRDRLAEREAGLSFDDPINIQYTSGTTGFPKGATLSHHNILNNAFFIGERCRYTEQDRVLRPGAVLPLLRHGPRQPGLHDARGLHRDPGPRVRSGADAGRGPGRAVHVAVRRADDVHRRARAARLRPL